MASLAAVELPCVEEVTFRLLRLCVVPGSSRRWVLLLTRVTLKVLMKAATSRTLIFVLSSSTPGKAKDEYIDEGENPSNQIHDCIGMYSSKD